MSRLQEQVPTTETVRPDLLRIPGCYPVQADTWLLADTMADLGCASGARVLDLCTGTGALAVAAALAGAAEVTAVDLSFRSSANAWVNARRHGVEVAVLRGDLFGALTGSRQFDLITANPPYVPSFSTRLSRHRLGRCWDGGPDGRVLLDRICGEAYDRVAPGGSLLLVQSNVADEERTLESLRDNGFEAEVVRREVEEFGPVMRSRARAMSGHGLIAEDQVVEELVVVRATRAATSDAMQSLELEATG